MKNKEAETLKSYAKLFAWCFLISQLTGCGVMGVREFEVWKGGPKWEFTEGVDFHVGANGIDNVEDRRGVSSRSRKAAAPTTTGY